MVHWEQAKRMLRYLKGMVGEGLAYCPGEDIVVWGYSDATDRSDDKTKKGGPGFVFMSVGAAVKQGSKSQDVVALSSTEAQYMAICHAMHEGPYLKMLQQECFVRALRTFPSHSYAGVSGEVFEHSRDALDPADSASWFDLFF